MKLNPNKCAFGVTAGKFLGFMVSQRGIEVNPEKVRAIMELEPPRMVKEVQSLNGKIAALNRFVLRATDRCLPFFRTLRKSFKWTDECQTAFTDSEGISLISTVAQFIHAGRRTLLILSRFTSCSKRSFSERG